MNINFNKLSSLADIFQFSDSIVNLVKRGINCCRVAVVDEFNAEELTVKTHLVNKFLIGINDDGSQETIDFPPIYAKVCYCNSNITMPIASGTAGLLLFSDREIESYFINGDVNNLAYERMHDITDAIFIPAVYSFVNVDSARLVSECLHLFYGNSDIQIKDSTIIVNTATFEASDTIKAKDVIVTNGASGTFTSQDGKTVTVTKGIVTSITE